MERLSSSMRRLLSFANAAGSALDWRTVVMRTYGWRQASLRAEGRSIVAATTSTAERVEWTSIPARKWGVLSR